MKRLAECRADCVRDNDMIYRYGGEEFVVLLRNTKKPGAIKITVSAGLSSSRKNDTVKVFLERSDTALFEAKQQGHNCVVVADN